jgi:hypothetical protein
MAETHGDYSDPLIDEVREVRRAVIGECGNDLRKLVEDLRKIERAEPERVVRRRASGRVSTPSE